MKRSIEKELKKWKDDNRRKPLLLRGARQVGKTFLIRKFAQEQFENCVEINFERQPELRSLFDTLVPHEVVKTIQLSKNIQLIPGKTLLFLDEIQDCPHAIMALRYFKEEMPDLHIIGAGSLLEFTLNDDNFRMPVGRIQFLYLYPLSFREFLDATGNEHLHEYLKTIDLTVKIQPLIHQQLLNLVKIYMVLGGMPAVVEDYRIRNDIHSCQEIQTDLLATYRSDFGKYSTKTQHKYLQLLFEKAPGLIAQWFKYSKVDPDVQSRDLKIALNQLCDAGLIHLVHATSAEDLPLVSSLNTKKFKLLFLDIGLVYRALRLDANLLLREDILLVNRGALAEQFVGQQLLTVMNSRESGRLFFWNREAKNSSAEIDYVINVDADIIPIEVKAGVTGRMKSLKMFMESKKSLLGIRISEEPFSQNGNILNVPFYLIDEIAILTRSIIDRSSQLDGRFQD